MELNTFGSIMKFSLELESLLKEFLQKAENRELFSGKEELNLHLNKETDKHLKLLERTRREGVNEMILESISGLKSEDYALDYENLKSVEIDISLILRQAIETHIRFYSDVSEKTPIHEVRSAFKQIVKKKTKTLDSL